jgi:hypothetical protein
MKIIIVVLSFVALAFSQGVAVMFLSLSRESPESLRLKMMLLTI